jgi:general secretion pathway protein G
MDRTRGFTLVEMLVVILILGLLATLVVVNVRGHADSAREKVSSSMLVQFRQAVDLFKLDHGRYPDRLDDLVRRPPDVRSWPPGGYLTELPADPWGRAYAYRVPGPDGRPFEVRSAGEDGREGTEDDLTCGSRGRK